ncbi:MAG TPA: outer membrane beta-barrel protein [Allosphingosinicella sp.]|jgi:outer membrane immunogenic protein
MLKYCLAAAVAAAGLATPVFAQDAEPAPAGPSQFNGFKAEAVAGITDDVFVGGALGYDFQKGKLVVGVEGEATTSIGRECEVLMSSIQDRLCVKLGRDLYAGGRVGIVVGSGTLLYAKAGYTNLRLKDTYDPGTAGGSGFEFTRHLDGVRVGAGIEQKLGSNAYVKGEYRYSNYESDSWKHDGLIGIGFRF